MDSLTKKTIRLAYTNKEVRPYLLPLLREANSADFLEKRVTNPDTGNLVKVKSLKTKPKDSKGHRLYLRMLEQERASKPSWADKKIRSPKDTVKNTETFVDKMSNIFKDSSVPKSVKDTVNESLDVYRSYSKNPEQFNKIVSATVKNIADEAKSLGVSVKETLLSLLSKVGEFLSEAVRGIQMVGTGVSVAAGHLLFVADQVLRGKERDKAYKEAKIPESYIEEEPPELLITKEYLDLSSKAKSLAKASDLNDNDVEQIQAFVQTSSKDLPKDAKAIQERFLAECEDPSTKARIAEMDADEFLEFLKALVKKD
jgi:hypothetical protein